MSRLVSCVTICLILVSTACGGGAPLEDVSDDWTETDSAGVAVITQRIDPSLELTLTELWRVGTLGGDDATQFYQPRDAAFGDDGTIYVMDSGNHRVKAFSAEGDFLFSFGSEGSGPGEFERMAASIVIAGETMAIGDAGRRLHAFELDGTPIATIAAATSLPPGSYPGRIVRDRDRDRWLLTVSQVFDVEKGGAVEGQPTSLHEFDFTDGIGPPSGLTFNGILPVVTVGEIGWQVSPIYQQRPVIFHDDLGRLYRVFGEEYGWEVWGADGTLERRVVVNTEDRIPVLEADIERYADGRRERCRTQPNSECDMYLEEALPTQLALENPEFKPAIYQLDGSSRGDLLVLRADLGNDIIDGFASKTYEFFDPEGRLRGRFERPATFRVIGVTPDRLLAVERDELDVESVVLYRIQDSN
jgi:6-bladed beta-propeller protein